VITSFPSGGTYLNDVVVSDTIQYDEFFSGKRTEGIYTVSSAFIPKLVSLFAQAIPLSLLSIFGFIPTQNGYVHTQPSQVIYYIKTVFAVFPMILCVISFLFKLKYPINDDMNEQIKKGIDLQKMEFENLKRENINYYKINDPVYEKKHINIIPNTDEYNIKNSVKTIDFLNHFYSYHFLFLIYNHETIELKKILKAVIIICSSLSLLSFILLLYTFDYLSEQKYSFIPITDLFILTALIITIILFYLKLRALNLLLNGDFELDIKMVKLFIFAKMANNRDMIYEKNFKKSKENKLE
jgi:hypothetical protein